LARLFVRARFEIGGRSSHGRDVASVTVIVGRRRGLFLARDLSTFAPNMFAGRLSIACEDGVRTLRLINPLRKKSGSASEDSELVVEFR